MSAYPEAQLPRIYEEAAAVVAAQYLRSANGEPQFHCNMDDDVVIPGTTFDSKVKGDKGIYAAMDAAYLARALRGSTSSRLQHWQALGVPPGSQLNTLAVSGSAATAVFAAAGSLNSVSPMNKSLSMKARQSPAASAAASVTAAPSGDMLLGMPPASLDKTNGAEVERRVVEALAAAIAANPRTAGEAAAVAAVLNSPEKAIGIPADNLTYHAVASRVQLMQAGEVVSYDVLLRLLAALELPESATTEVDLSCGAMSPRATKATTPSLEVWAAKTQELEQRFPLAVKEAAVPAEGQEEEEEEEEEVDETASENDPTKHNALLREVCAKLGIEYTNYADTLQALATYELQVLPALCRYLGSNEKAAVRRLKVLNLDGNDLGAPTSDVGADGEATGLQLHLAPLRALAKLIDENESLQYLSLARNRLGPRGLGILCKALTKNISLSGVDFSDNNLNQEAGAEEEAEEVEDPAHEEEDPVFGETYAGLEAISEVLKKNKFLRVLRLAHNGIHAGDTLSGAPPEQEEGGDIHDFGLPRTITEAHEQYEGLPLWTLLSPLTRYHRLTVLDLAGNKLGNAGAQMLAIALSQNRSIEVLDLTNNQIGFRGLCALATRVVGTPTSRLHTLILRQNALSLYRASTSSRPGNDGPQIKKKYLKFALAAMDAMTAAMERNPTLRVLNLANNHMGPDLSAALLRTLPLLASLEELDISFNELCGDHPSRFVADALSCVAAALYQQHRQASPSLSRLRLDGNNIGPQGMALLFPEVGALGLPHSFRELSLARNGLGNTLAPLSTLLVNSTATLERLDLSYNGIESATQLLPGLARSSSLIVLNLSHNKLGVQEGLLSGLEAAAQVADVAQLCATLAAMPALSSLDVSWNDLRDDHAELLCMAVTEGRGGAGLQHVNITHNPRLSAEMVLRLTECLAMCPKMQVVYTTLPPSSSSRQEALKVLGRVCEQSHTLLDVSCGLPQSESLTEASVEEEQMITLIREKLLLNALTS